MPIPAEIPRDNGPESTAMLHAPADASHFRVKVGRYGDRWYTDPLPTCTVAEASEWQGPAFSIVKKGASGSDWTYVALGRAAFDIESNPQVYTGGRESVYARLKHANDHGLKVAGGRGTIVHWWFEDALNGRPFRKIDPELKIAGIPPESIPEALTFLPAVGAFFDTYQPELVVAEVVCMDRDLNGVGYGCTGDAGLLIEGDLLAADWKSRGDSSDHGIYPEEAAQVGGAFPRAQYCIVDDGNGGAKRAPMPDFSGAVIVSVKSEGCRIYPVDIDKARAHYEAMHEWWVHRRDERKTYGRAWPPKIAAPAAPKAVEQRAGEGSASPSPATIAACDDGKIVATDTQPAPGAAAPGAHPSPSMSDDEARAAYGKLDDDAKREVCRLRDEHIATEARTGKLVSKAEATKLALGWIAPFDVELPQTTRCRSCKAPIRWVETGGRRRMPLDPEPVEGGNVLIDHGLAVVLTVAEIALHDHPEGLYVSHFATCPNADQHRAKPVRFTGDEGNAISAEDAAQARGWLEALAESHPEAFAAVHQVAKQAHDIGIGFHVVQKPTRRRFEIYRGLLHLSRWCFALPDNPEFDVDRDDFDSTARDLLAAVTDDEACLQPGVPLGQVVGLLDAGQAAQFAYMASQLAPQLALAGA